MDRAVNYTEPVGYQATLRDVNRCFGFTALGVSLLPVFPGTVGEKY